MKSDRSNLYIYLFTVFLITALVILAVLQYQWIGRVSEAQEQRLSENVKSAVQNMVSDFDRVLSELYSTFSIQHLDSDLVVDSLLSDKYRQWLSTADTNRVLLDQLYYAVEDEDSVYFQKFIPGENRLEESSQISEDLSRRVESYLGNLRKNEKDIGNPLLFGEPSLMILPIKRLQIQFSNANAADMPTLIQDESPDNNFVLIKLNDDYLKNRVVPSLAQKYLSGSFEDQYYLAISKPNKEGIYFSNSGKNVTDVIDKPDVVHPLGDLRRDKVILLTFLEQKSINEDNFEIKLTREFNIKDFSGDKNIKKNIRIDGNYPDSINSYFRKTGFTGLMDSGPTEWSIYIQHKKGSVEAYVASTRWNNLAISFGILLLMGISIFLIVVYTQRVRKLANQKMNFVAGVSHELKTPLSVIRSAAENLSDGLISDKEKSREYGSLILEQGRRLSRLVNQVMEYAGIQSGNRNYEFEVCEIKTLFDSLKKETGEYLDKKGFTVECYLDSELPVIVADKEALTGALENLVHNAVKFSNGKRKLVIRGAESSVNPRMVEITLKDYGIGIPQNEQKLIFNPFYRGSLPLKKQIPGNGLGLSLVKNVVEVHNGEIKVISEEGKGTEFIIQLPVFENN